MAPSVQQNHSTTPPLHRSTTPPLHHSITPPLHHSTTPSLHHSITPSLHHSTAPFRPPPSPSRPRALLLPPSPLSYIENPEGIPGENMDYTPRDGGSPRDLLRSAPSIAARSNRK